MLDKKSNKHLNRTVAYDNKNNIDNTEIENNSNKTVNKNIFIDSYSQSNKNMNRYITNRNDSNNIKKKIEIFEPKNKNNKTNQIPFSKKINSSKNVGKNLFNNNK